MTLVHSHQIQGYIHLGGSNGIRVRQLQCDLRDSFWCEANHSRGWDVGSAPIRMPEAIGKAGVLFGTL